MRARPAMYVRSAEGLDESDFVYLLQAHVALAERTLWSRELDQILGGEFSGCCPECGADPYIAVEEYGFFVSAEEWVNRPETKRVPIRASSPEDLAGTELWPHRQALEANREQLSTWLVHAFGWSSCPACGSSVRIPGALAAAGRDCRPFCGLAAT
jgi:hypothetical protein